MQEVRTSRTHKIEKDMKLIDAWIKQYPHGFNDGFLYTDGVCPALTISSWTHNNFVMEIYGDTDTEQKQIPQKKYPTMTTDQHLNVITLFSGYDSQALALNRLGLPYDLAAWCEIDRHAITAHNALFPQWKDRNLGDVSQVDWAEWHASHPPAHRPPHL